MKMTSSEFKLFCKEEFIRRGFSKVGNMYYLRGENKVSCGLYLQKSNYGKIYYVNYYFFVESNLQGDEYPSRYDFDLQGRIHVMSKTLKYKEQCFWSAQIEYEEYTEEELGEYFENAFENIIFPPIYEGKKYILDYLDDKYFLSLKAEEVMSKLTS